MKTLRWMMALAALWTWTACSGSGQGAAQTKTPQKQTKKKPAARKAATEERTLVVFFSHAGENYAVGNVKVGNTKVVADYIVALTGADQFEIVTHRYDDMAYKPLCDLAKEEQQRGELPPFEGAPKGIEEYTTVFIGGPVWWGTWPQVMFTFFKKYAKPLEGKRIIPFTTHEGSGLGSCVTDLKKELPGTTVMGAFSVYGHDVRSSKATVERWLKQLGY